MQDVGHLFLCVWPSGHGPRREMNNKELGVGNMLLSFLAHFWKYPEPTPHGWLLPLTFGGPRCSAVPQSEQPSSVLHVWGPQRQGVALLVSSHDFTKGLSGLGMCQ